jgi:hypothetical protein
MPEMSQLSVLTRKFVSKHYLGRLRLHELLNDLFASFSVSISWSSNEACEFIQHSYHTRLVFVKHKVFVVPALTIAANVI